MNGQIQFLIQRSLGYAMLVSKKDDQNWQFSSPFDGMFFPKEGSAVQLMVMTDNCAACCIDRIGTSVYWASRDPLREIVHVCSDAC